MQIGSPGIIGNNIITIGGSGPGIQIYRPRQKGITIPFYTTQAATDVRITVTGTPDILWTWADGTTSTTADPGAHDMSGTDGHCSLYVSDALAITRFETNAWKSACDFYVELSVLKKCKNLTYLHFYHTNTAGDIYNLFNINKLSWLVLSITNVSGNVSILSGATNLIRLFLSDTSISGDISNLSGMTKLTHLYLYNTDISGNLSNISNMTNLVQLLLNNTNISETDMSNMVSQMYLIRTILGGNSCDIRIQDCNGITADAIAMIEGTGAYAGDGLKDAGCTVVY